MEICFNKNYHLGQPISQTAYSKVYKATEINSGRFFCIKEIDLSVVPEKVAQMKLLSAVNAEAQTLAQAGDKIAKIPCLFDSYHDRTHNKFYIIMQWIEGTSLRKSMACKPSTFLAYILRLAEILQELHKLHIYHKDIKPENVIVVGKDVRLIDFNISLTLPNTIDGTPVYAAPEMQTPDGTVTRKHCDVFSLGVMLYEYFTGEAPINGIHYAPDFMEPDNACWDVFLSAKELAQKKGLPPVNEKIDQIITKCMQKTPSARYETMDAFIHQMRQAMRCYNDKR